MASPTAHAPDKSTIEQIVLEFFAKSLHIILESRIPFQCCGEVESLGSSASSSSSGPKTRDRWFNLALGDCTSALENFEPWRRSFSDPMVVDVLLVQPKVVDGNMQSPAAATAGHHWAKGGARLEFGTEGPSSTGEGTVLERWIVQFERRKNSASSVLSSKGAASILSGMTRDTKRGNNAGEGLGEVHEMRSTSKGAVSGSGGCTFKDAEAGEGALKGGTVLPAYVKDVGAVYKRAVIMLRSLYSWCRLLPAYRLFRLASTSSHSCSFSLTYRVLSSAPPLSEDEERDMLIYRFTAVETPYGRMRLSVASRPTTAVTALEVVPPILPRIIPDYVGSPTTDPLKRFPGEPHSIPASGICRVRGVHMVSVPSSVQNSPPCSSLGRRHSWSGGVEQMLPTLQPPSSPSYRISRSPSPSHPYDSNPSPPYPPSPFSPSRKHPSSDYSFSPRSSPLTSADRFAGVQQTNLYRPKSISQPINIERCQSPPFSSSPSPSPPTCYSREKTPGKGPAWSGSAPVSIPKPSYSRLPKCATGELQLGRNLLPPPSPKARRAEMSHRSTSDSPRYSGQLVPHTQRATSFESPLQLRMLHVDYGLQVCRNEGTGSGYTAGHYFRGHLQPTLPRASSKGVLMDDTDDDFTCPFAVYDDEADEKQSRSNNTREKGKVSESPGCLVPKVSQQTSQNAAVGALVRLLRSASALPLRQSSSPPASTVGSSSNSMEAKKLEVTCGNAVFKERTGELLAALEQNSEMLSMHYTKTATDALKELQDYKKIRDLILNHSDDVTEKGPRGIRNTMVSDGNR